VPRVHPSAVIEPGAKIDDDVVIGAFAFVGSDVELAGGVELRPHAHVCGRTTVGEGTRIFPFAVLGEEPQDKSFSGETTQLLVGRDNVIREHVTIHIGTPKGGGCTRIGDDNFIMNGVHLGHDVEVGSHCIIASYCAFGGHAVVEDHAVIGGLSGIHQFARIGESVMVAAASAISKDVTPFALVAGRRARVSGLNVVGLRRRGMSAEVRAEIKHAFHILFNSKMRLEPALERLRAEHFECAEVGRLLHFIENSKRGFCR
jgi:UDP-N-acetylglucosamine acyltransferase